MAATRRKKSTRNATRTKRTANPKRRKRASTARKPPVRRKSQPVARKPNPVRRRRKRSSTATRPAAPQRRRRKVARQANPGHPVRRRKSRRLSNQGFSAKGFLGGIMNGIKDAGRAALVVLPTLALKNAIGNFKVKAEDGVTEITLAEKVGPLYDLAAATVALAVIPPVLGKVGLGKFQEPGKWGLKIVWLLTAAKTAVHYARRGWTSDQPVLAGEAYPAWTDLLDVGSKGLQGASYVNGQWTGGRQRLSGAGGMGMYPQTSANEAIWGNHGNRRAA